MAKGFFPPKESIDIGLEKNSPEPNNNTSSDSTKMSSVRAGLTLPLQQMAIPIYTAPSRQDVEVGGRVLFQNFIHEELVHEGLSEDVIEIENPPPDVFGDAGPEVDVDAVLPERAASPALLSTPDGYNNQHFITLGATIREIADQFGVSHERKLIKEQADQVDLKKITKDTFSNMLNELFRNGIDKYCIVALFYFCSDVVIRCVRNELHKVGSRLFFWALEFLVRNVCKWVYDHGGWERVFSKFYNVAMKISAAVALGVIITCGIIFIRKNM